MGEHKATPAGTKQVPRLTELRILVPTELEKEFREVHADAVKRTKDIPASAGDCLSFVLWDFMKSFVSIEKPKNEKAKGPKVMEVCGEVIFAETFDEKSEFVPAITCARPKGHEGPHDERMDPREFGLGGEEPTSGVSSPSLVLPNAKGIAKFGKGR